MNAGVAWPRRALTTLIGTPALGRSVGVAEVVKADARQAGSGNELLERSRQHLRIDRRVVVVAIDVPTLVWPRTPQTVLLGFARQA